MNFSGISDKTLLGKALRFPLRLLPPDTKLLILQGKLRGRKWIVGSSNHGCWLGSYEDEKRKAFEGVVERNGVVFDIGAHVGFYTLLASVLVGRQGKVIAFEPLPRNLRYLKSHLALNRVTNVSVVDAAVADTSGTVCFEEGPTHSMGHIAGEGSLRVPAVTLDEIVFARKIPPPAVVKVDVEGAEGLVLKGARRVLATYHPVVFLATHSKELHCECAAFLRSLSYELEPIPEVRAEWNDEIIARVRW